MKTQAGERTPQCYTGPTECGCFFPTRDDLEFPRSWLVPVIRDHVKNTNLSFFSSYFLPLASTLKQRGKRMQNAPPPGSDCDAVFTICVYQLMTFYVVAEELDQVGQKLEARVYKTLQMQVATHTFSTGQSSSERVVMSVLFFQIWTMLPGFCTCPLDLLASFKGIARTLGMVINERPDLRLTVCQALRTIVTKSSSTGMKMHASHREKHHM